jgi:hypothetical protein
LLAAAIPLAHDGLSSPLTVAIAIAALGLLLATKLEVLWIILGSAA